MHGFSLLEALLVVAVIGLAAAVVIPVVQQSPDAAKREKLEQDVVVVNNAIDSYLAAGGSQGALSAGGVIEALKQKVLGGVAAEMTGAMGPFLDPRVITNASDFNWSARFESIPRPRFVVQNTSNGIVFGRGLPSPIGGPSSPSEPSWLWSYSPATATPVSKPVFEPVPVDSGTVLGTTNAVVVPLVCPDINPASQTLALGGFPLQVSLANPNPAGSSIAYYRIGTAEEPETGSWVLWVGAPFNVNPGSVVTATAVSVDPSRYYNSTACSETYDVTPLALSISVSAPTGVTYAQAGGEMVGQVRLLPVTATISLDNASSIPAPYLSSAYISIRYTLDGSDPAISATALPVPPPSFSGSFTPVSVSLGLSAWGTNASLRIRAAAVSTKPKWFTTGIGEGTATREVTPLALNVFPVNPVGLPLQVVVSETGAVPVGLRKYYTANGASPLTSVSGGLSAAGAVLYVTNIPGSSLPSTSYVFKAQATGPSGYESWFSSVPVTRNYNTVTTLPSEFVGANISGGDVNGNFSGSIFVSAPANLGIFNAGGQITGGNLYVPGLPAIEIPGSGNSTKTVVARGQAYVERGEIPRTLVGGKEFAAGGGLADPQLDTRQVVDLNGAVTPTNYTVKLTKSAYIEGKIYRRADAPPPPAVPVVPTGLPVYTNTISGAFTNTILPGVYSNRITMNTTNSLLRLGVAGSGSVAQYVFSGNTWNKGRVEILGPVEIYFLSGFDNKGVTFGNSNSIALGSTTSLRINVMTNAVDITGGGSVFASLWAANSAVTVGNASFFYGSLYAQTLTVSPGGTVDVD